MPDTFPLEELRLLLEQVRTADTESKTVRRIEIDLAPRRDVVKEREVST